MVVVSRFQWKKPPLCFEGFVVLDDVWHHEREWPGYDFNDGTYGGLPRTLRKLWEANRVEIERILHGKEPAQRVLF